MRTVHTRLSLVLFIAVAAIVANAIMVLSGNGYTLYSGL